eukprot:CAMPEP_0172443508 /NCGR_PEP_ID=MMETSP1065-20121228/3760_1 /TAXON_ID=265537 /ORGANISM="Amphiprora paludosa, Strain CCMP125" /LENGTH=416 /DNA_ID=CAMNT_0013193773 /DNA_START=274 /DNA_END=1524 /DNA_ORIENTATION=+
MVKSSNLQTSQVAAGEPININVETNNVRPSNTGSNFGRAALAVSKPAMIGAGILALGTAALGVFDIFRMPGLEEQIKDLEEQVDRLEVEVDRLSEENDRFEELNEDLKESLGDLASINRELNETATELEEQVELLNNTVANLSDITDELVANGEEFETLNQELNQTQQDLETEIVELQVLEANLTELNQELANHTVELQIQVFQLTNVTTGLEESVTELEGTVQNVTAANALLGRAVDDLTTVTQYMESVHDGFDDSFETVAVGLNNTIKATRANVFLNLFSYYNDIIGQWTCRNRDLFQDYPFWDFPTEPILDSGLVALGELSATLNNRMLKLMCLTLTDFEQYLVASEGPIDTVSYDAYTRAAINYGGFALTHYGLPVGTCVDGVDCVTAEEWEDGGFECENVEQYRWADDSRV